MDTDEGAKTTRKIVESVCIARGWVHSDSEGYPLHTNSPLLTARSRRKGPGLMASRGEMSGGDSQRGQDVTESPTLLQIPLCVTAGPSDEGDPNLHHPALVDPAHDLDRREAPEGARPKVGPRFSTQMIAGRPKDPRGDRFLPASVRTAEDIRSACMEGTCVHGTRKSWDIHSSRRVARDLRREYLCGG